jgi:hypothetical protein
VLWTSGKQIVRTEPLAPANCVKTLTDGEECICEIMLPVSAIELWMVDSSNLWWRCFCIVQESWLFAVNCVRKSVVIIRTVEMLLLVWRVGRREWLVTFYLENKEIHRLLVFHNCKVCYFSLFYRKNMFIVDTSTVTPMYLKTRNYNDVFKVL